jgi:ribosome-associated protein
MRKESETLSTKKLTDIVIELALQKKAENIVLFNPGNESPIADWFMICEGTNEIHTRAIGEAILLGLKEKNSPPWHHEGLELGRWILIDFIDVVVNVILPELRHYYELDKLWEDCKPVYITERSGEKPQKKSTTKRNGGRKRQF